MRSKKSILGDKKENNTLYSQYKLLSLSLFKWSNLPNGIEQKNIEKWLYNFGQVAFYNDKAYGLLCLKCNSTGRLNVYGEPTSYILTGVGYSKIVKSDEIVRIINNDLNIPTRYFIDYYVTQLAEIDKSILMNIKQQKFPYIISCTKENEYSLRSMIKKLNDGDMEIYVDKEFSDSGNVGINCIKTNSPYVVDKLQLEKYEIEKTLLSFLGINTTLEKKERLLTDEINSNNNYISLNLEMMYKNRLMACEKINEKFNLDIKVEKTALTLEEHFKTTLNKEV